MRRRPRTNPLPSADPQIPGTLNRHNPCMDETRSKIIELLREVHLLTLKEVERLNLRIAELKAQNRQPRVSEIVAAPVNQVRLSAPAIMNERDVAFFLEMSVAAVRR